MVLKVLKIQSELLRNSIFWVVLLDCMSQREWATYFLLKGVKQLHFECSFEWCMNERDSVYVACSDPLAKGYLPPCILRKIQLR